MTESEWQLLVLEKLRRLVIGGYLSGFVGWVYEDDSNRASENSALLYFKSMGVCSVYELLDNSLIEDDKGVPVVSEEKFGAADMTKNNSRSYAVVGELNNEAYEKQCADFGLHPKQELYKARIKFNGIGTPVVTVLGKQYKFHSMKIDSYKERLFSIVSQKPDQLFTLADIKAHKGFSTATRITDITENNYFTKELSPFADINKDAITFHSEADITREQVEAIKAKARKS